MHLPGGKLMGAYRMALDTPSRVLSVVTRLLFIYMILVINIHEITTIM